MSTSENSEAVAAIDAAVARLLAQVEALRYARAILAGLEAPAAQAPRPTLPPAGPPRGQPSPGSQPGQGPEPSARRGRGIGRSTLELREKLKTLLGEGVLDVQELSRRLGRPATSVYQALSNAGLSLRRAREQWEAGRGVVERGPDPVPPAPGPGTPSPGQVAGLDFGGVVFVRRSDPLDFARAPTYLRCTVVSLPDESGKFTVKGPDGENILLEVGDAVAPFRDGTPTFRLGAVGGGEAAPGAGEPDPSGEGEAVGVSGGTAPPGAGGDSSGPRLAPFGTSFDFSGDWRAAAVPELRAEAVRRQRGHSGKSVQFATSFAAGHAHVASVDRMGYGTTVKDASGHVHRVVKWEVVPACGAGGHPSRHGLTLSPPSRDPVPPRGERSSRGS
jgi:hypothetical protein